MSKTTERACAYAARARTGARSSYSAPFQKRLASAWLDGWNDRRFESGGSNFDAPLRDAWKDGRAEGARLARLWN
jgi:ribosome modulation factor